MTLMLEQIGKPSGFWALFVLTLQLNKIKGL